MNLLVANRLPYPASLQINGFVPSHIGAARDPLTPTYARLTSAHVEALNALAEDDPRRVAFGRLERPSDNGTLPV